MNTILDLPNFFLKCVFDDDGDNKTKKTVATLRLMGKKSFLTINSVETLGFQSFNFLQPNCSGNPGFPEQ